MHRPDQEMAVLTGQRTEILHGEKKSFPELNFKPERESTRKVHVRGVRLNAGTLIGRLFF